MEELTLIPGGGGGGLFPLQHHGKGLPCQIELADGADSDARIWVTNCRGDNGGKVRGQPQR